MRVLIVGPQGAGKGTQAALLAENLKIPHISTGDIFRANVTAGTELGVLAKKYMDAGELVPDEVTSAMVKARLEEPDADGGFLLDGFPRTVPQAQWLGGVLHENDHDLDAVLLLDAPDDVLLERMLARGRADDTADAITRRLALYHSETTPLLEHYADLLVADRRRRHCRRGAAARADRTEAHGPERASSRPSVADMVERGIQLKTRGELQAMRASGRVLAAAIAAGPGGVTPGVTTLDVNDAVAAVIAEAGATSNFLHYGAHGVGPGFPCDHLRVRERRGRARHPAGRPGAARG